MKVRGLLLLVLVLAIMLLLTSIFHYETVATTGYAGSGYTVVDVAKESYVYARVEILVQPDILYNATTTMCCVYSRVSFTYPNGTSVTLNSPTTITVVLPNTLALGSLSPSAGGPDYYVTPASPLSVQVISRQNESSISTQRADEAPVPGIDFYQYVLKGDFELTVQAFGVSL